MFNTFTGAFEDKTDMNSSCMQYTCLNNIMKYIKYKMDIVIRLKMVLKN